MKERLRFVGAYFTFWVGYFVLAKIAFLCWYWRPTAAAGVGTIAGTILHGLRMDAATTAYLMTLPLLLLLLSSYTPWRLLRPVLVWWTGIFIVVVAALTVGDIGLFAEWGFRIDSTWLAYLNRPAEMLASTGSTPVIPLLLLMLALGAAGFWGFRRWALPPADAWPRTGWPVVPVTVLLVAILVLVSRGGIQLTALNQSSVYFSSNDFANQAALNAGWNFFNSVWHRGYDRSNPYVYLPAKQAESQLDDALAGGIGRPPALLRVARPNVVLIIWESLTAKIAGVTGGRRGIVPNLDSLARQGILFDHFYATGNRTDKGLPGIFSGYPSIATRGVTKDPRKYAGLPGLPADLARAGYALRFVYGGELAWANFQGYLRHVGFGELTGEKDFSTELSHNQWGIHDGPMFQRARAIVDSLRRPFLLSILTLSSHDPYTIPATPLYPGREGEPAFLSAHHYTDATLGEFIAALHASPLWDSTLVIILGDHGHLMPVLDATTGRFAPSSFHIPMLWLGGALAVHDTVVHTLASQVDLAPTLLAQLGLPAADFPWGRDLLAPDYRPMAFYAFQDGFGLLTRHGNAAYDNAARRVLAGPVGPLDSTALRIGMALQQRLMDDYVAR